MIGAPSFDECPSAFTQQDISRAPKRVSRAGIGRTTDAQRVCANERQLSSVYCASSLSFAKGVSSRRRAAEVDHVSLLASAAPVPVARGPPSSLWQAGDAGKHPIPVRPMPYHPHTNATTAETNPRAALRLLVHLLDALRSSGGSGSNCVSINHYVEDLRVNAEDSCVYLTVDVKRLFEHSPFANSQHSDCESAGYQTFGVFDSDLTKALETIRLMHGTTVDICLVPLMSSQRTTDEFVDQFVHDGSGRRLNPSGGNKWSSLHYFNPVCFPVQGKKRACCASDIICGFVVPDLLQATHLAPDRDSFPFEPMFFEKMDCLFQWFNGDATSSRFLNSTDSKAAGRLACSTTQGAMDTTSQGGTMRTLGEGDIVSAYSSAVHQRPSMTPHGELPHPQWFQPFSVRLPHRLQSAQLRKTTPVSVGSTVNTLEHGLKPLTLPLASDLLDRALVLAVLRLCSEV